MQSAVQVRLPVEAAKDAREGACFMGTKDNNSKRRKGSARKNGVVEFWDECTCFVDNWLDLVSELIRLGVETFVASFRKGRSLVGTRPVSG